MGHEEYWYCQICGTYMSASHTPHDLPTNLPTKNKDHEIDTIRNAADPSKWDKVQRTLYDETTWIWKFVENFQVWSDYMYGNEG